MDENNNRPFQPQGQVTIGDILNIRMALEQIKEPSAKITQTMDILDDHLLTFAKSLKSN